MDASGNTNSDRITQVLREYAEREIPDDFNMWANMNSKALVIARQLQAQPLDQRRRLLTDVDVPTGSAQMSVTHSRQWRQRRQWLSAPAVIISLVMVLVFGSLMLYAGAKNGSSLGIPLTDQPTIDNGRTVITNFVPPGMVRHLVINHNTVSNRQDQQWIATGERTEEAWYTQGETHLLMKDAIYGWEENQGKDNTFIWVTDDAIYRHEQWNNQVSRYPFNSYYLQIWGPSPGGLDAFLKQPPGYDYEVVEHTTLQGHPVAKLAHIPSTIPQPDASPTPVIENLDSEMRVESYVWFDTEEQRPLQYEYISRYTGGQMEGLVITSTARIIEDEMLERRSLSEDIFTFKMPVDAELKEDEKDPFARSPDSK